MIIADRLNDLIRERGLSQAEVARRVGVSQQAVGKLVFGGSSGSRHLHVIARVLGTSPAYLTGETDDPSADAVPVPTAADIAEHLDLVEVVSIDANYGLGGTFIGPDVDETVLHFPRAFIESITLSPPVSLTWARGRGDSMFPTIGDGDLVLIDRSNRTPREQDALWALTVGEMAMIKRLRVRGETVTILSDNDRVPPDQAHADEVNIVGRVVFVGRRT